MKFLYQGIAERTDQFMNGLGGKAMGQRVLMPSPGIAN